MKTPHTCNFQYPTESMPHVSTICSWNPVTTSQRRCLDCMSMISVVWSEPASLERKANNPLYHLHIACYVGWDGLNAHPPQHSISIIPMRQLVRMTNDSRLPACLPVALGIAFLLHNPHRAKALRRSCGVEGGEKHQDSWLAQMEGETCGIAGCITAAS